jgi:hypothetical protein
LSGEHIILFYYYPISPVLRSAAVTQQKVRCCIGVGVASKIPSRDELQKKKLEHFYGFMVLLGLAASGDQNEPIKKKTSERHLARKFSVGGGGAQKATS